MEALTELALLTELLPTNAFTAPRILPRLPLLAKAGPADNPSRVRDVAPEMNNV